MPDSNKVVWHTRGMNVSPSICMLYKTLYYIALYCKNVIGKHLIQITLLLKWCETFMFSLYTYRRSYTDIYPGEICGNPPKHCGDF